MKKNIICKIFVTLLFSVTLLSICFISRANSVNNSNVLASSNSESEKGNIKRPTYTETVKNVEEKLQDLDGDNKLQDEKERKKEIDKFAGEITTDFFEFVEDPKNADYIEMYMDYTKACLQLLPVGGDFAASLIDGIKNIGDDPQSELVKLQNHLDEKFEDVHERFDELQDEITKLSNSIDASTKEILEGLSYAFEADYAKAEVIDFMSNSKNGFSYELFKNYLFGSYENIENPLYYNQAYLMQYNKLVDENDCNPTETLENEILKIRNKLYAALLSTESYGNSNLNMLYDYALYNEKSGRQSIQRYYYEYLSSNKQFLGNRNAEYEAIKFIYDLYNTIYKAENIISDFNAQIAIEMKEMYGQSLTEYSEYDYGNGIVTYGEILNNVDASNKRLNSLEKQIVSDITYILNLEGSITVKDEYGYSRIMTNLDENTFGKVHQGQTIYLNKMFNRFLDEEFFAFNSEYFTYEWYIDGIYKGQNDGYWKVTEDYNKIEGCVKFQGKKLYSVVISLNDNDEINFNGGSGSVEDPYVIKNAQQFNLINTEKGGLDKHYILIDDIDFKGIDFSVIGSETKPFKGSLNGNGYYIKNINCSNKEATGIFNYVDYSGIVKNLNLKDSSFTCLTTEQEKTYSASICGYNNGKILNCAIYNCNIKTEQDLGKKLLNKHLTIYVGGICGFNNGTISGCKVSGGTISGVITRNYGAESDSSNTTTAYVAGICSDMTANSKVVNCCVVESTSLSAKVNAYCDDSFSTRHPYAYVYAGGITSNAKNSYNIENVYSNVNIVDCSGNVKNKAITGGSNKNNVTTKKHNYVVGISDEELERIKKNNLNEIDLGVQRQDYVVSYEFNENKNKQYGCYESQLYECCEKDFKIKNLKIKINDKVLSNYSIISYYGFDTLNRNKEKVVSKEVIVVFLFVNECGETIIEQLILPIYIKPNAPTSLEVETLPTQTNYNLGEEIVLDGSKFVLKYQDGTSEDVTSLVNISYDTTKYNGSFVEVSYENYKTSFEIFIICNHNYESKIINPTCSSLGYTLNSCKCGDAYKTNFVEKIDHSTQLINYVEATCTNEGYTGDYYCAMCDEIVNYGYITEKLSHDFVNGNKDLNSHYCKNCEYGEEHLFVTNEQELEVLCNCMHCNYSTSFSVNDRESIEKLPRVLVSDAYALPGSNEVTVYIELHSSVAITSALFSIYFDNRLTLVSYDYGNILYKPSASGFKIYSDHINISLNQANSETSNVDYNKSNTLAKLVFKTPNDAKEGDEYNIIISNKYEVRNEKIEFVDKFTDSKAEPLDFVSINGKVKVVNRLPGDVTGDGILDLLDALIISKYSVEDISDRPVFVQNMKETYNNFDISYGDVSFDNNVNNTDIVRILRYIIGGYQTKLISKKLQIILNYNGIDGIKESVLAQFNEEGKIFLEDLPTELERDGYKFDGWYYGFEKDANAFNTEYVWQKNAITQTLYGHWTLNTISFDGNGATEGDMVSISYKSNKEWEVANSFNKFSNVYYNSIYSQSTDIRNVIKHNFLGWALSPNSEVVYKVGDKISLEKDQIGDVTLYAIWDTSIEVLPNINRLGYELLQWSNDSENFYKVGIPGDSIEITNHTTLYAKWETISYYIEYDGNGALSGVVLDDKNNLRSEENKYKLVTNGYKCKGKEFVGWNTQPDGSGLSFKNEEIVGYINTEINGKVVLYAQWTDKTYDIKFESNYPSFVLSPNYKGSDGGDMSPMENCNYFDSINLKNNVFFIEGMIFKGWSLSPESDISYFNGASVSELTENESITLYAIWEINTREIGPCVTNGTIVENTLKTDSYMVYNTIDSTPWNPTYPKTIIDWRNESETDLTKHTKRSVIDKRYNNIDIVSDISEEVIFIGNKDLTFTNFRMYLCNYTSFKNLTLTFDNFKFKTNESEAISLYNTTGINLTINVLGESSISTSVDGGNIINFSGVESTINFIGSGSMSISAGNGSNGEDRTDNSSKAGGNGSNGGVGVLATDVIIDLKGSLSVSGGAGGKGGKGSKATGDKEDGTKGGKGGAGGNAITATNVTLVSGEVTFTGGNGGVGGAGGRGDNGGFLDKDGDGGDGGAGGAAGNGISATTISIASSVSGKVNGGNGGKGGNGGNAGAGGSNKSYGGTGASGGKKGYGVSCTYYDSSANNLTVSDGTNGSKGSNGSNSK